MKRFRWFALITLSLASICAAQSKPALTQPDFYPFAIPWDDAAPGTATDVSFLNDTRPAGSHGRIIVKDGRFIESDTGKRVRFLGINLAAQAAFPTHEDADKLAAALAKYGINVVRLHHMDNGWGLPHGSLIDLTRHDRQHLVADQIDRLDYLVFALAKRGIYSNINLKVSHEYIEADGLPASIKDLPSPLQKRVDAFDDRLIALQKDYARQLLTHVNPYTQKSFSNDPAVAFVEINNENSLLGSPWESFGGGLAEGLPEPFKGELSAKWNSWLKQKYVGDAALATAWKPLEPLGEPLLHASSQWTTEHQGKSQVTVREETVHGNLDLNAARSVSFDVTAIDGPAWYVQGHITGLDMKDRQVYTLHFRARTDRPRSVIVGAAVDQADWHNVGLNTDLKLTTEWQSFTLTFQCHDPVAAHTRIAFILGGVTGTVWIDGLSLRSGAEGVGLLPGQSLAAGNVPLPVAVEEQQRKDWLTFLADTELNYADGMRSFLRNELNVKANLIDTQIDYGGLTGLRREAGSDYTDNHAYWQHPNFPNKPWDLRDWMIRNTPLVNELGQGHGGDLGGLAYSRVADKPYVISEYDHPAPSDYTAEMLPLLCTFAARQDWDGLYLFCMGPYGEAGGQLAGEEKIGGFFDVWDHPGVRAFLPTAALIFRGERMQIAPSGQILSLPQNAFLRWPTALSAWEHKTVSPLDMRLSIKVAPATNPVESPSPLGFVTGGRGKSKLEIIQTQAGAVFTATSNTLAVAAGFIGGNEIASGPVGFSLTGPEFAAATLVTLDQKSIADSNHLLLTVVGQSRNDGWQWNAARTTIGANWGRGPVQTQRIGGTISLPIGKGKVAAFALNKSGGRQTPLSIATTDAARTITLNGQTLWYEIVVGD